MVLGLKGASEKDVRIIIIQKCRNPFVVFFQYYMRYGCLEISMIGYWNIDCYLESINI